MDWHNDREHAGEFLGGGRVQPRVDQQRASREPDEGTHPTVDGARPGPPGRRHVHQSQWREESERRCRSLSRWPVLWGEPIGADHWERRPHQSTTYTGLGTIMPHDNQNEEVQRYEYRYRKQQDEDEEEKNKSDVASPLASSQNRTPARSSSGKTKADLSREEKRRGRTCRVDGCDNYIVHKGVCCRHGGTRRCTTEGCKSTAKYMGLCWKHGGSTWCKVDGCTKRAKAKGRCWAHGGGTICSHTACTKVAVSNGLCWAHGGGKRCLYDGCNRPGYERTNGFCDRHYEEMQHVDYFEV